jgi:FtsP/CotA-like multicopper oxidase with cupredoxin domain
MGEGEMKFHTVLNRAAIAAMLLAAGPTFAQSFRTQCPFGTLTHPAAVGTVAGTSGLEAVDSMIPTDPNRPTAAIANPQIKCQEISGGDGYATMADGHQIYLFAFGPLSGLKNIQSNIEGTVGAAEFNAPYANGPLLPTDLATLSGTNAAATEPSLIMNLGVMSGETPAPSIAVDEDDELYLTLSNVGMIMRPDLFEQHTVHWHGYPNASSYFDGVPDASVAINIAGSFTYYYISPDAGTYFWHCHITPPEHLQMGMEGNLWVRPRQNRLNAGSSLYAALYNYENPATPLIVAPTGTTLQAYPNVAFPPENCATDILCTTPVPPANTAVQVVANDGSGTNTMKYAYNDGDGTTRYDVEAPIQLMGFDPTFHFIGMTFNQEPFVDMKDKYYLMSGRGYPDTIGGGAVDPAVPQGIDAGPLKTEDSDGAQRFSQPVSSKIVLNKSGLHQTKALLRISNLSVTEFHYLATAGIPMQVIAHAGRLLRDTAGNNMYYNTNTLEVGPGDNADVILDASNVAPGTYFLYTPSLDRLSNDAENFGGMMTEIQVN